MSGTGLVGGGLAQLSARGLHALFGAALLPIVARHLGAEAMRHYVLVLSIVTFIVTAGDAGLPLLAQRELPTAPSTALVRSVRTARRRTAVILVAVAVPVAAGLAPAELRTPLLVGLLGVPAVLSSNLAAAELTAALAPGVIARIEVPVRVVTFVGTLFVVLAGGGVTAVVGVGTGGSYLAAVLAAVAVRRRTANRSTITAPIPATMSVLRRAAPLALLPTSRCCARWRVKRPSTSTPSTFTPSARRSRLRRRSPTHDGRPPDEHARRGSPGPRRVRTPSRCSGSSRTPADQPVDIGVDREACLPRRR